jgi:peptide/nickel transport system ATP-binding protein
VDTAVNNLLEVRDLTVCYAVSNSRPVRALSGVNLEVRGGEILAILGESGSGKTTLASSIVRLFPPCATSGGSILFRGTDLLRLTESQLATTRGREIALVPQDPAVCLNPVMTVGDQIAEVLRAHLFMSPKQRRVRVNELLGEVGLDSSVGSAFPHQLSGGQRQRIVIAQAVACRPTLVIADEPTSKLDSRLRADIINLLSKIRTVHGTAVVIITHDPVLPAGFADRIAVMYAGRVIEIASRDQIFKQPLHPYTQALFRIAQSHQEAKAAHRRHLPTIEGNPPDPTISAVGCSFEPRCPERAEICALRFPREISLEPSRVVSCVKYER